MTPKTDQQTTVPAKAGWTRPQLKPLGTIADVAMAKVSGSFDGPHS